MRLHQEPSAPASRLPAKLAENAAAIAAIEARLADPELFRRDPDAFTAATAQLERLQAERHALEERWLALEMLRERAEG